MKFAQKVRLLSPELPSPVKMLNGKKLGIYTVVINGKAKQVQGHFDLCLYLENEKGEKSKAPCIKGLYSVGRKDTSYHYFDAQFLPSVYFASSEINLMEENLAEELFKLLGNIIRSGGQFYLSYINDQIFASQMEKAFKLGVPPMVTVLGKLLFISGCIQVKSFFGAEGRFRIEGEKPIHDRVAVKWAEEALDKLSRYRSNEKSKTALDLQCRENARHLMRLLRSMIDQKSSLDA